MTLLLESLPMKVRKMDSDDETDRIEVKDGVGGR